MLKARSSSRRRSHNIGALEEERVRRIVTDERGPPTYSVDEYVQKRLATRPPKKAKKKVGRLEALNSSSPQPSDKDAPLRSLKLVMALETR